MIVISLLLTICVQLAYEAWVAGAKSALKRHKKDESNLQREERRRARRELQKKKGFWDFIFFVSGSV